jgi:peptide/nickel transport system substrate-binding protein
MKTVARRQVEEYRRRKAGPLENTLIDEFASGELDRADLIRRGSVLGVSASTIGAVLVAFGEAPLAFAKPVAAKVGGRLRVAINPGPTGPIDPHLANNYGQLVSTGIAGEYLARATQRLVIQSELAVKWTPNKTASVWTFKLRPNVKFQSGQTLSADDVVTTYKRLVDPKTGTQALSAFLGTLSPEGVRKVDDMTVAFHLDAANVSFPYLTSAYQAIILPADYKVGTFTSTPQTTAAFQVKSYNPGVGITYDRFDGWWGGRASLDGVDGTYFSDAAQAVAQLLAGNQDLLGQFTLNDGHAIFSNPKLQVLTSHASTHRQITMRVDKDPFTDHRVRQAIALSFDRKAVIKTLFNNLADLGNDSPFAPIFPSTVKVPQRHQDLRLAKQLLAAAGHSKGFTIHLTTEQYQEIPALAQILQASLRKIGVNLMLKIVPVNVYFAGSQTGPPDGWGNTPWLNADMTITDYGHRPIPNTVLVSTMKTHGVWNAAHYSNPKFDQLLKAFIGAPSIADQRKYARQMELIALHDTPLIIPYFYNWLAGASKKVHGYQASGDGQIYLSKTSLA